MRTYSVISLCLLSTLAGCLDAGAGDPSDLSDDAEAPSDVTAQALCFVPTPPTADIGWSLLPGEDKTFPVTSYGTGACSHVTFAFGPATEISGSVVGNITSRTACENTTVTGRFYQRIGSTWTFLDSKSDTGTWGLFGCTEPEIRYEVPATGPDHGQLAVAEMRLSLSASRESCTTTTPQLCGTQHGVPVESTGGRHEHF